MPKIRDFLEPQKVCIFRVRGEPPWTHCFQEKDQGGSRLGPSYHTDSTPSQQEIHAVLLGQGKPPPEIYLRLCANSQAHTGHD